MTTLTVGRLGYGAMQLPGPQVWGPPADQDIALAVLRRAVELGVTHIDTSDAYGPHVANDLIRQALHPYPDDLVIATKVGIVRDEWKSFNAAAKPAELREQVEENLARLGRPRLDLVYLRVGGDGLLYPDETPQDVAFVPYFPLAAGLLRPGLDTSGFPPGMAPSAEQERTLDEVAARHGATRAQVALAWLLGRSPVVLAIPGTGSLAHLEENVAAAGLRLTGEDRAELEAF